MTNILFNHPAVLLVEDNPTNQFAVNQLLKPAGIDLDCASDGRAALNSIERRDDFKLILMDVEMPGMDGITATREIRQRWPDRNLPILGITAATLPEDR